MQLAVDSEKISFNSNPQHRYYSRLILETYRFSDIQQRAYDLGIGEEIRLRLRSILRSLARRLEKISLDNDIDELSAIELNCGFIDYLLFLNQELSRTEIKTNQLRARWEIFRAEIMREKAILVNNKHANHYQQALGMKIVDDYDLNNSNADDNNNDSTYLLARPDDRFNLYEEGISTEITAITKTQPVELYDALLQVMCPSTQTEITTTQKDDLTLLGRNNG